jgi:hypothetical protein
MPRSEVKFPARHGALRVISTAAVAAALALSAGAGLAAAQATPVVAADPSARLRQVLPADVADRLLARIAAARSRGLPAPALEQRALKFAARGVPPADIERSVDQQAERMEVARDAIERARTGRRAQGDEIEAGAEAIRQGVDGAAVSALARSAPSGRSLAVPLYVIGSLASRGLPSDEALARVRDKLAANASDADLEQLPAQAANAAANARGGATPPGSDAAASRRPSEVGRDLAGARRGTGGGAGTAGPPAGVPANGGAAARPTKPTKPGKGKPPGTGKP